MMAPFAERRHRLHGDEVPEAIAGLRLRLLQHLKTKSDLYEAQVAFRAFYRLSTYCKGRPDYPSPLTWTLMESYLNGTISEEEGD